VPASQGHYVENIGNTTLKYLEIFKTGKYKFFHAFYFLLTAHGSAHFQDISLAQVCYSLFVLVVLVANGTTVACPDSAAACQGSPQSLRRDDRQLQQDQGRGRLLRPVINVVAQVLVGVLFALARARLRFVFARCSRKVFPNDD
jgi:hypothetical protein